MEVRKVFAATLEKMMRENENIVMLDADLAKAGGTFGLREIFPDRAFDVGITEALVRDLCVEKNFRPNSG